MAPERKTESRHHRHTWLLQCEQSLPLSLAEVFLDNTPTNVFTIDSAVYFNPAKTAGAMVEADLYCLIALAWAAFLSIGSMATFWEIDIIPGWEWLADALVLLWLGAGMTVVAWMKVRMAKPTFNTGMSHNSSMTVWMI